MTAAFVIYLRNGVAVAGPGAILGIQFVQRRIKKRTERKMNEDFKNRIVYEDRHLIVVNKPAGLAVETARVTEPDLQSRLRAYLAEGGSENSGLFMVHRLDQPVEGLVAFALTKKAAASLTEQLNNGGMRKIYTALVSGGIPAEEGELVDYLLRDPGKRMALVVPKDRKGAKKAVLRYRKAGEGILEIELETGRFHQIRAQLAHAGMPVKGDVKYGGGDAADSRFQRGRIALCASALAFKHPASGKELVFEIRPSFTENSFG